MVKIGYRTIKTAIATPLAIWLAELFQLDNFVSAGIIAVLCIQTTRKRSFLSAWHRFGACLVAMVYSFVIFETLGYHPISIGLLLLVFIPTTIKLNLTPGIVTSSVILLHLYSATYITWELVWNEVLLIIIGIGSALLLNLYMPSLESKLQSLRKKVEKNFQQILEEIAVYLHEGEKNWTGKEITETEKLFRQADLLVSRDAENHLLREEHPYKDYFDMRKKQFELLKRMLPVISQMNEFTEQSDRIGSFFDDLAEAVHPGNTANKHLDSVDDLKKQFEEDDLPKTREEFESRANLFQLLHEIEEYLEIKKARTPEKLTKI
ncbi:aromatic acid exporter family protein [Paraliobacillus zengyii]|uniref:aromatic acid exporter family protein n=1 Tax=Paraliobacillus zengyii TaxID=2213194 RepID=UPI000DD45B20|nr:aromatic acid exporter family protein [Paraliobacillus zengyii]